MSLIIAGLGGPSTFSSASGGKVYAYNAVSTTPAEVAPVNTARQKITFHNPGTVDIFIAPAYVVNTGSNVALAPTTAALGGCFRVFANGGTLEITGECQGAWNAFSASASTNPLTVMDTNC
jgi:hypothetical protein